MDSRLMNKNYKAGGVHGTRWNSQQGPDDYRLQFETDNEALYKYMEKAAKKCIDKARKLKKKENK